MRSTTLLSTAALVLLAGVVIAESLNLFRPLPKPGFVVSEMQDAISALPTYQARMMAFGGAGSPGDTCDQWRNSKGEVVTVVRSMFGTQYVERWHGDVWEFYHPGLSLQGKITVRNKDRLTCPHWLISGYPTVQEFVTALSTASEQVIDGKGSESGQEVWVLSCQPNFVEQSGMSARHQPPLLTQRWRAMILRSTRLPNQIFPAEGTKNGISGISIAFVKAAEPPVEADWRKLAGAVNVRQVKTYICDAAKPETVDRVVNELRDRFQAYQRTRYPLNPKPDLR